MSVAAKGQGGIANYYQQKTDHLEIFLQDRIQDLRRQEAQRNELNAQGNPFLALHYRKLVSSLFGRP